MKAEKLGAPPDDIRTEWRRTDNLIDDVETLYQATSSHPHLINVYVNGGGWVADCSGLVAALARKGIDLTIL